MATPASSFGASLQVERIEFGAPLPDDVRAELEASLLSDIRRQIDVVDTSIPTPAPREVR